MYKDIYPRQYLRAVLTLTLTNKDAPSRTKKYPDSGITGACNFESPGGHRSVDGAITPEIQDDVCGNCKLVYVLVLFGVPIILH